MRMRYQTDLKKDERYKRRRIRKWDDYCSMFYNGLLDIDMKSIMKFFQEDLDKLRVQECVAAMSNSMGIGTIATTLYPYFTNLTR